MPTPETHNVQTSELASAIVAAVTATQPPRKIANDEFLRTTSVHAGKPKLKRKFFQNGFELSERQLSKDAIELLNRVQPGNYCDFQIKVVAVRDGQNRTGFNIQYNNKTIRERYGIAAKAGHSLEQILARIVAEAQPPKQSARA